MRTLIGLLLAVVGLWAQPATYTIDAGHSTVQFSVRHLAIANVKGVFQKFSGQVVWDAANPAAARLEATVDVNSIDTRQAKRDAHLKSADFLDAAKFPSMTFQSRTVKKTPAGLEMTGDLTLHGVTKAVTFAVEGPTGEIRDQMGGRRMGATATAKINRKEFGLNYNALLETGGMVVGEEVTITIEAELVRQK